MLAIHHRRHTFRPLLERLEQRINPGFFNDIWQYDEGAVQFDEITPLDPKPTARRDHAAAVSSNLLVVQGGMNVDGSILGDLKAYRTDQEEWVLLFEEGDLPGARFDHTLTSLANPAPFGTLALFGGMTISSTLADAAIYLFNVAGNTWTKGAVHPEGGRTGHSAFSLNDDVYIFGGVGMDGQKRNDLWVFGGGMWSMVNVAGDKPPPRKDAANAQALVDGDNDMETETWEFVFGGDGSELSDTWGFNTQTMTWTQFADMPAALIGAQAAAFDDAGVMRILVYGGSSGGQPTASAFLFTPDTNTWQVLDLPAPNPGPRVGHSLVTVNGVPILFGGVDNIVTGANLTLRRNGANLQVLSGANVVHTQALTDATPLQLNGANAQNDILTVNFNFGGFFTPAAPLSWNAGTGTDRLQAVGNVNFTLTNTALTSGAFQLTLSSVEQARLTGGAGNNLFNASAFTGRSTLRGGAGKDTLRGGASADVLVGGQGNDVLQGNNGRDLLIGGAGADVLQGGAGEDILVAGATRHDGNPAALDALMAEWVRAIGYVNRVGHLRGTLPGGLNVPRFLRTATLLGDGPVRDTLTGGTGLDWFLARSLSDVLRDRLSTEFFTATS